MVEDIVDLTNGKESKQKIINANLPEYKYVTFEEGSHYIQWNGVTCNKCLKFITVRAYFNSSLSTFDRIIQLTAKCDCGVKIFKMNGILTLIPRQIYNKEKHNNNKHELTIKDVITIKPTTTTNKNNSKDDKLNDKQKTTNI